MLWITNTVTEVKKVACKAERISVGISGDHNLKTFSSTYLSSGCIRVVHPVYAI